MSAPTSPNLPRSDQSFADADFRFADLFSFEGADELWQSWRDGLTPDPLLDEARREARAADRLMIEVSEKLKAMERTP